MTLTTRTTRKAPWAVALTALLAVLALVFGVLTMAAPATAKDDPNKEPPGHSATFVPPGQDDVLPPGQDPDFVPPGQLDDDDDPTNDAKKVHICHADVNNGQGQPNLGQGGTGGQSGTGFNLLYISKAAASNAHFKLHPNDRYATDVEIAQGFCGEKTGGTLCYVPTLTKVSFDDITSKAYTDALASPDYTTDLARCTPVVPTPGKLCQLSTLKVVDYLDITSKAYTDALASADFTTELARCTPVVPTPGTLCYLPTLTRVPFDDITATAYTDALASIDYTTDLTRCITPDEAAAIDAALAEPATVAPVLPGTVAEEPETVAVPAPATVPMPATIPAGDGSGVPTVPAYVLALLVLGATALAASTVRLVRTTR